MSAVQPYESGEGLEEISFNRSDSIVVQRSAENERIEGLSENEKIAFNHITHHLLQVLKFREILERIRFNGGNLVILQKSTDQKYDERRMLVMLSDERASNGREE